MTPHLNKKSNNSGYQMRPGKSTQVSEGCILTTADAVRKLEICSRIWSSGHQKSLKYVPLGIVLEQIHDLGAEFVHIWVPKVKSSRSHRDP